jgi:hypothetical protein
MLITQADVIPVAKSIQFRGGPFFFETEEAARHFRVGSLLLEDTFQDHHY